MKASLDAEFRLLTQIVRANDAASAVLAKVNALCGRELGITGPQWSVLSVIFEVNAKSGVPVKDVAKVLTVEGSFVTLQANLLEARGFIKRMPSPSDRRLVYLTLTAGGEREVLRLRHKLSLLWLEVSRELNSSQLVSHLVQLEKAARRLHALFRAT